MTLTLQRALDIVHAAIQQGSERGVPVAVAVVDRGGRILASARSEQAGFINLKAAQRKAVASANFGAPSHAVLEMVKSDGVLLDAVMSEEDTLLLPGGFPIVVDGVPVGGFGIAGGHYSQDQAIGEHVAAGF